MDPIPSDDAAFSVRKIDAGAWDDVYVVGDVHGCRRTFERLLDELDPDEDDLVVAVGDLVRKGPDSAGVIDLVREREGVISVRGNNEAKLLRGDEELPSLDEDDLDWIADLPLAIAWEGALVVHGGVHPEVPIADHEPETLLTMRSPQGGGYDGPFWFDAYEGPPRVFFGHTVLEAPVEREWAVGIDTGCVYGGALTAYDCTRDRFVSVEADETHEPRSDEKFVPATSGSA